MAKLFFSYCHKDEGLRDQLEVHLALMKNQDLIESWHDRRITAGSEVDASISEALEQADVILLLISADFIASNYCYSKEMARAMERHEARTARVIPVILRDCEWHSAPFGKLLAAPKDGKPVMLWPDIDQALTDVAKQVRRAITERQTAPVAIPRPVAQPAAVAAAPELPRSSNLRLKKEFSARDQDEFLRQGFEYLAKFFEGSQEAVAKRNDGVDGTFERIDSRRFACRLYKQGKLLSECSVRLEGLSRRANGIAFAFDASAQAGSFNELLSVEADDQHMYFKAMGLQFGRTDRGARLTFEGAAEFLWGLHIERLQ